MIAASQLRPGMAIHYQDQDYKVLAADYHPGQGKMGGVTHARLRSLETGTQWEHNFRADMKLDDLPIEKKAMHYLYSDEGFHVFMNPDTCEQAEVPENLVGEKGRFLTPEMRISVEFLSEKPVSLEMPAILEVKIADTAPAVHAQQDSTWKTAVLENGVEIQVPQFIKTGEVIRLDLETLKYMDRAKTPSA